MLDFYLSKREKWLLVVIVVLIVSNFAFWLKGKEVPPPEFLNNQEVESTKEHSASSNLNSAFIMVDIKGAVNRPGVYQLKEGSRVNELIQLAGGFLDNADTTKVNLAQKLRDEAIIYVPTIGENNLIATRNANVTTTVNTNLSTEGRISLNYGTLADFMTLDGIGEAKAQAIIKYREENNGFKSLEELKNVTGIGEKTFEKLKDKIVLY